MPTALHSAARAALAALILASVAPGVGPAAAAASGEPDLPAAVAEAAAGLMPNRTPDAIRPSALPGLYEVVYGTQIVHLSADGAFAVTGDVVDLKTRRNLTDGSRKLARSKVLQSLDPAGLIVFAPEQPRHTVTVFTDVHCGYCQKLHQEVPELNAAGVAVRYAAFPAIRPTSMQDHVSVWCAEDRKQAITDAKAGKEIVARTCANPVDRQFEVGRKLGVQGTPAIVLEDGEVLPGYVPARQLVQRLEAAAETRAAVAR